MKVSTICPCCSSPLLHHFDHHREYWFCRHCWEEMPNIENIQEKHQQFLKAISLSTGFNNLNQPLLIS